MRFFLHRNDSKSRTTPEEAGDNKYHTSTTSSSVICYVDTTGDGTGSPRTFSDVFVKGKNIQSVDVIGHGSTSTNMGMSFQAFDTTTNDSDEIVSTNIRGFQNMLFSLGRQENGTSVRLNFSPVSGQTLEVTEVLVLDEFLRLEEDAIQLNPRFRPIRSGVVQVGAGNSYSYSPGVNRARDKWRYTTEIFFYRNVDGVDIRHKLDTLLTLMFDYPNFAFAPEYHRYPDLLYPAMFPDLEHDISYIIRNKDEGRRFPISIQER